MTTAAILRCDAGGLANISREIYRHLAPDRTLLVDLDDRGRGECIAGEYANDPNVYRTTFAGEIPDGAIDWLCAPGVSTLFTIETFYSNDKILTAAHRSGIATVCYAMPELAPWAADPTLRPRPRVIYIPTTWRAETLPMATVLPLPIARDRLPFRQRTEVQHLVHITGAAMLDRNGTNLVLSALPHVHEKCRLTIRTERPIDLLPGGNVDVEVVSKRADHYWQVIPEDGDLLVLPRRYGGLSLPVIECASLGIPSLTLTSDPYASLPFVHSLSPTKFQSALMKGGRNIPVWTADPRALANAIDHLIRNPDVNAAASKAADLWAEQHAWHSELGMKWCRALAAGCAEEVAA